MYECVAQEYCGLCINIFLLVYKNYPILDKTNQECKTIRIR